MGIAQLKKIAVAIEKKQNSIFAYPVKKQQAFIKKLGHPKDELERSFFQYRCQMKLYGGLVSAALNAAALPMSLVCLIKFRRNRTVFSHSCNAVFMNHGIPENIVPTSLREKYKEIQTTFYEMQCLDTEDITFLKKIFARYPFAWLLWFKVIHKVSRYSAAIKRYTPSAILCCDEFSYTSSIMTKYCREKGVKLINVMHGEKIYFMRDSFVCYDEYYVWNTHYKNLLIELGAEPSQFRVEMPESLKIPQGEVIEKVYDYTYYLAAEKPQVLEKIARSLGDLQKQGYKVAVRPHPRYSEMDATRMIFENIAVEDTKSVSIEKSLLQTKSAISLYSTVLNQAMHNGVNVVVDDVSNPENYYKLKERKYCILSIEHKRLSEIVGG